MQIVQKPLSEDMLRGEHSFYLNSSNLSSGTYILVVINGNTKASALLKVLR